MKGQVSRAVKRTQRGHNGTSQQDVKLRAVVTGRVQGVGYRCFAQRLAVAFGLVGYVRNISDGSVELVASGSREYLEQLVGQLWVGPPSSRVEGVTTEWAAPGSDSRSFHIRF